jgi:hypothetical protein
MKKKKFLFTLLVWQESLDQQQTEWRGQIKHLVNGEVRYFRDAHSLYVTMQNMLPDSVEQEPPDVADEQNT